MLLMCVMAGSEHVSKEGLAVGWETTVPALCSLPAQEGGGSRTCHAGTGRVSCRDSERTLCASTDVTLLMVVLCPSRHSLQEQSSPAPGSIPENTGFLFWCRIL